MKKQKKLMIMSSMATIRRRVNNRCKYSYIKELNLLKNNILY